MNPNPTPPEAAPHTLKDQLAQIKLAEQLKDAHLRTLGVLSQRAPRKDADMGESDTV